LDKKAAKQAKEEAAMDPEELKMDKAAAAVKDSDLVENKPKKKPAISDAAKSAANFADTMTV
jgi:hypothetical protein